jgi:hypothetical protein
LGIRSTGGGITRRRRRGQDAGRRDGRRLKRARRGGTARRSAVEAGGGAGEIRVRGGSTGHGWEGARVRGEVAWITGGGGVCNCYLPITADVYGTSDLSNE